MSYSEEQTLFRLAMSSQLGAGLHGSKADVEAGTAQAIETELGCAREHMGRWKLVWGPAAFIAGNRPGFPDNMMYVAEGTETNGNPWLVVSIAGTNPRSLFDQLFENPPVAPLPWPTSRNPRLRPRVASGAFFGFQILSTLKPGRPQPGAESSLTEFLRAKVSKRSNLTVTAHSLGSAVGCLLALWLLEMQPNWDPYGYATIYSYPFAGPSSGDASFSEYYSSSFAMRSTRYYNRLDVVPHAWNADSLLTISGLYNPPIDASALVPLVFLISLAVRPTGYLQVYPNAKPLPGSSLKRSSAPTAKSPIVAFIDEQKYQHVGAYFDLLEIGREAQHLRDTLEGNAPESTVAATELAVRAGDAEE